MTRLALLALAAAAVVAWVRRPRKVVEADPYAEPVPMTAWDGTAQVTHTGNNATTIRVRWTPTEVTR